MISAVFIVLAFILSASQPTPAQAQSFAECQAWLCLAGRLLCLGVFCRRSSSHAGGCG